MTAWLHHTPVSAGRLVKRVLYLLLFGVILFGVGAQTVAAAGLTVQLNGVTDAAHVVGPVTVTARVGFPTPCQYNVSVTRILPAWQGEPLATQRLDYRNADLQITHTPPSTWDVVIPSFATDGNYALAFTANCDTNAPGTWNLSWTIDSTMPSVDVDDVQQGAFYNVPPSPHIRVADRNLNSVELTVLRDLQAFSTPCTLSVPPGGVYDCVFQTTVDGVYTITAAGVDIAGNRTEVIRTFTVDTVAPDVDLSGVTDGSYIASPPTVSTDASDLNLNTVDITTTPGPFSCVDNTDDSNADPHVFACSAVATGDGVWTVTAVATDRAGNSDTATRTFTVDTTFPLSSIDGVGEGGAYNTAQTVIVDASDINLNDNVVVTATPGPFSCADAVDNGLGLFHCTGTAATEGDWTITAVAIDLANNRTTAMRSFLIDLTDPNITVSGPTEGAFYNSPQSVSIAVDDPHLFTVTVTPSDLGCPVYAGGTSYACSGTASTEGDWTVVVTASDTARNQVNSPPLHFTIDMTQPEVTIAGVNHGGVYRLTQEAVVSISDLHLTTATVTMTLNDQPTSVTCTDDDLTDSRFECTARIAAGGLWVVTATGTDAALNTRTVVTPFTVDRDRPAIAITGIAADACVQSPLSVAAAVTDLDPHTSVVARLDRDGQELDTQTGLTSTFAIQQAGDYQLTVTATDGAGNSASATRRFCLDLTDPVVTVTEPADGAPVRTDSIAIRGSTTERWLTSVVVNPGAHVASIGGDLWAFTSYPLQDGANTITVTATDRAGRTASTTVTVHRDGTAPTVVLDTLPALTSDRDLTVTGTASDSDLDEVRLNGRLVVDLNGTSVPYSVNESTRLSEGVNTIALLGRDLSGNEATAAGAIRLDTRCELLVVMAPGDGHRTRESSIVFSGIARDVTGITLVINGAPATLVDDAFSQSVSLAEGLNEISLVGTDGAGNTCTRRTMVELDTVGPILVSHTPAAGASGVPLEVPLILEFSEDLASTVGITVSVGGDFTRDGARVVFHPTGGWPSDATVTVTVAATVTDALGNPLTNPTSFTFTTVDQTGPVSLELEPVDAETNLASIAVCGTTESGAQVRVAGHVATTQATANSVGYFCQTVALEANTLNQLVVRAFDAQGNLSGAMVLYVQQETVQPVVLTATLESDATVTVVFSKTMNCATVTAVEVLANDGTQPIDHSVTCQGEFATVTPVDPAQFLQPFVLQVFTGAHDTLGNALAFPYSKLFNGGDTMITGEVYDASTGFRLEGADVEVVAIAATPPGDPVPHDTSDEHGEFALSVFAVGNTWVRASMAGYVSVHRTVVTSPSLAVPVFDMRLMPLAPAQAIPTSGGTLLFSNNRVLATFAPGSSGSIRITSLAQQGLPARLPAGWSPAYAVDVAPDTFVFNPPLTLRVPNSLALTPGDNLQLVRLDPTTLDWVVGIPPTVATDLATLVASVTQAGCYAFVVGDVLPVAVPTVALGEVLLGVGNPTVPDLIASASVTPGVIFPSGRAEVQVRIETLEPATSGIPLQADFKQQLTLLDDSRIELPKVVQDVVGYSDGSDFPAQAQRAPGLDVFREGRIDIELYEFPMNLPSGGVIDDGGSSISIGEWTLDSPAGAVDGPTPVVMVAREASELSLPAPDNANTPGVDFELMKAVELSFGGVTLQHGASLSVLASGIGLAETDRVVLARIGEVIGRLCWVYVAPASYDAATERLSSVALIGDPPTSVDVPGARRSGAYAFLRVDPGLAWGYIDGQVVDTSPPEDVDGAPVDGWSGAIVGLTFDGGKVATIAYIGPVGGSPTRGLVRIGAESPRTRDRGAITTNLVDDLLGGGTIQLQARPPSVVSISPANGATNVSVNSSIQILFSEPVQPQTVQSGVQLSVGGQVIAGAVLSFLNGTQAVFDPDGSLPPNAQIDAQVLASVLDFAEHGCVPATFSFTTLDTRPPSAPAVGDVTVYAPNPNGYLLVVTPPMSGDIVAVTATNLNTGYSLTLTCTPTQCSGQIWGEYGHTIRITYIDGAGNTAVEDHRLLREQGAIPATIVGAAGGRFAASDGDGLVVLDVPAGAYSEATLVEIDPKPVSEVEVVETPGFDQVQAFDLNTNGTLAEADLTIRLPANGLVVAPDDLLMLVRVIEVDGVRHPEFIAHMRVGSDGLLETSSPPLELDTTPTAAGVRHSDASAATASAATDSPPPPDRGPAGVRRQGEHLLIRGQASRLAVAYYLAHVGGGVTAVLASYDTFPVFAAAADLENYPAVIPVLAGVEFDVNFYDPGTGALVFHRRHPPIPGGHGAVDAALAQEIGPLWVTSLRPVRTYWLHATRMSDHAGPGIAVTADAADANQDGVPDTAEFNVNITGASAAAPAGATVRAVNGRTGLTVSSTATNDGTFALGPLAVRLGDAVTIAIDAVDVDPEREIVLDVNHNVDVPVVQNGATLTRVGPGESSLPIALTVAGRGRRFTLHPSQQLELGATYELGLNITSGPNNVNGMVGPFVGRFQTMSVSGPGNINTFASDDPNDMVRVGSVLFVAAGSAGVKVLDVSRPWALSQLGAAATPGRARGIGVFRHDQQLHLAVVGGGEAGQGYLRLFDVSTPAKLAAPLLVRNEEVSNQLGSGLVNHLSEGVPVRVRAVDTTLYGQDHDLGLVAVLGVGLQVYDLTMLVEGGPHPHLSTHYSDTIRDVVPYEWNYNVMQNGVPAPASQLLAVLARGSRGLQVLDLSTPSQPESLSTLVLPGSARSVALWQQEDAQGQPSRTLAFIGAEENGVFVVDLTDPTAPQRVGQLLLPGRATDIVIDPVRRRALVSLGHEGLVLIDVSRPEGTLTADQLVLAEYHSQGVFNTGIVGDFELGTVYASSQGQGVVAMRYAVPRPQFVTDAGADFQPWSDLVPLGIPNQPGRAATWRFRVALSLPGGVGDRVFVSVDPLNAYGAAIRDPHWPQIASKLSSLQLDRMSSDLLDPKYNVFASGFVHLTADPLDRGIGTPVATMLAGDLLRAKLLHGSPGVDLQWLGSSEIESIQAEVLSWRMDLRDPNPAPFEGRSTGTGDVLGVTLDSGEFSWSETDLTVSGRLLDFGWSRQHRSQVLYRGPLGRGWDAPYLARIRALPTGDLEYFDGSGRASIIVKVGQTDTGAPTLLAESPQALAFEQRRDGFEVRDANGTRVYFTVEGDLDRAVDAFGNTMRFLRDGEGRLRTILDSLGRTYTVDWNSAGLIERVTDFSGRSIQYTYNTDAELTQVTRFSTYHTHYGYATFGDGRTGLKTITNEANQLWLDNTFTDAKVTTQQWGLDSETSTIAYDGPTTRVTDRRGKVVRYDHDTTGRILTVTHEGYSSDPPVTGFLYDEQGRTKSVTRPLGGKTEYTFQTSNDPLRRGNAKTITVTPDGRGGEVETTQLEYHAHLKAAVVKQTDPRGTVTTFAYAPATGALLKRSVELVPGSTDPAVAAVTADTTYEYTASGQVRKQTGPATTVNGTQTAGIVTESEYYSLAQPGGVVNTSPAPDAALGDEGYLKAVTVDVGGLAHKTAYLYDGLGRVTETTDPANTRHTRQYDPRGLVTQEVRDAGGSNYVVNRTWDSRGYPDLVTSVDTTTGSVVVDADHDTLGFKTKETVTGPGLAAPVVTSWTPDATHNVLTVTHPLGWTETMERDPRGLVTKVTRTGGDVTTEQSRTYDRNGNLKTVTNPRDATLITTTEYDGHDRVKRVETPLHAVTTRVYYPGGLLKKETAYDYPVEPAAGDPPPDPVVLSVTELEYDKQGYVTKKKQGPTPQGEEVYTVDEAGRVTKVKDRRGKDSLREHFKTGWLKKATDPLGNTVEYVYHKLGGVETETRRDALGTGPDAAMTLTTRYDSLGRRASYVDAANHTTRWHYDARDNVTMLVDALGKTTRYTFDGLNRQLTSTGPEEEKVESTYDVEGHLKTYKDANGNTTEYGHDSLGRQTSVTYPGTPALLYVYTYNSGDFVETETTPRGFVSTYTYDDDDRVKTRAVEPAGVSLRSASSADEEKFTYDALGRILKAENDTTLVTRAYNTFGQVTSETLKHKTAPVIERTLSRDYDAGLAVTSISYPSGRVIGVTPDELGRWNTATVSGAPLVDYDWRGPDRLLKKTVGSVARPLESTYAFNSERLLQAVERDVSGHRIVERSFAWTARHELDHEVDAVRQDKRSVFGYDAAGRLRQAAYVVPDGGDVSDAERSLNYTVDKVRNVISRSEAESGYPSELTSPVTVGNRYQQFAGEQLQYDGDGNLEQALSRTLTWDWKNRLVEVDGVGIPVQYTYDAFNRKVRRTSGQDTRLFWYDGWQLVEETDEVGAETFATVNGRVVDEPLMYWWSGEAYRPVQEQIGSVSALVDEAGKVVEAYEYDPYGRANVHHGERVDHIRFADEKVVVRFTGEMALSDAIAEYHLRMTGVTGQWEASADGREATFEPDDNNGDEHPDWPPGSITVTVDREIRSAFGIELEEARTATFTIANIANGVIADYVAPQVDVAGQDADGKLRLKLSERARPDGLGTGFRLTIVDGAGALGYTAALVDEGKTVEITPQEELTEGAEYRLEVLANGIKDLSGTSAAPTSWTWTVKGSPVRITSTGFQSNPVSLFGNRFFFQGRELDQTTGLYDFRNRWYDAELGRFLSRDPLGYPDGPNAYSAFLANPLAVTDPHGLSGKPWRQMVRDLGYRLTPGGRRIINSDKFRGVNVDTSLLRKSTQVKAALLERIDKRFPNLSIPYDAEGFLDVRKANYGGADKLIAGQVNIGSFSPTRGADDAAAWTKWIEQKGLDPANNLEHARMVAEHKSKYTWHHESTNGELTLLDREVHDAYRHTGGFSLKKAGLLAVVGLGIAIDMALPETGNTRNAIESGEGLLEAVSQDTVENLLPLGTAAVYVVGAGIDRSKQYRQNPTDKADELTAR